jgi:predicted amidohydrolase
MLGAAFDLLETAGEIGSDVALLPELINIYEVGQIEIDVAAKAGPELAILKDRVASKAARHGMYVILPVAESRDGGLYNTSIIFGRDGHIIGAYDKTHISQPERLQYPTMRAGNALPTFDLDFGRIAIMTCYDCSFPEVATTYALKGAEVLFYPRWQSGPSEIFFDIQMRARALDNSLFLVSSSFGVAPGVAWKPGMLFGRSCVIGRDGTILCDAGHDAGIATTVVDLDRVMLVECLDAAQGEGLIRNIRELLQEDRRPELYEYRSELATARVGVDSRQLAATAT